MKDLRNTILREMENSEKIIYEKYEKGSINVLTIITKYNDKNIIYRAQKGGNGITVKFIVLDEEMKKALI